MEAREESEQENVEYKIAVRRLKDHSAPTIDRLTNMSAHSQAVVDLFCELCLRLYRTYLIRRYLFDENPHIENFQHYHFNYLFVYLSEILQEQWLQQLAKLHDPAVQGGQVNLSLSYMIEYGAWGAETEAELRSLQLKMDTFAGSIRKARHKLLSHNDLAVLLNAKDDLGAFSQGQDKQYFDSLERFASIMKGSLFVYDDLVRNDIEAFMDCFNRGFDSKFNG